jgi:hypothetical protein
MPAGNYVGNVSRYTKIVDATMSTDTSAYANGDLLADTQAIDGALRLTNGTGIVNSIVVIDTDDQTLYTFSVWLLDVSTTLGTENSAPTAADAAALGVLGKVDFATTDGLDLGDAKVYVKTGLNIPVKAIADTDDLGVAMIVTTGTPTHSASGIRVRIGITQD